MRATRGCSRAMNLQHALMRAELTEYISEHRGHASVDHAVEDRSWHLQKVSGKILQLRSLHRLSSLRGAA